MATRTRRATIIDQRIRIEWSFQVANHLALGVLGRRKGERRALWAAITAGSVAIDELERRWMRADGRPHLVVRGAADVIEGIVWTLGCPPGRRSTIGVQALVASPPALEAGARLGAGVVAVPVPAAVRPFPPPPGTRLRSACEAVLPVLVPHLAVRWARRHRGEVWDRRAYQHLVVASVGGFVLARYRHGFHVAARRAWQARAEEQVKVERHAAGVRAAMRSSIGHDFKKNLLALGQAGSEAARLAAWEQAAHPAEVVGVASGTTVMRAALGIPVEPFERRDVWISSTQHLLLDEFIDAVDHELDTDGVRPVLTVGEPDGLTVEVTYRGRTLTLTNPEPRLGGPTSLDPVPLALPVLGALWKLMMVSRDDLPDPWPVVAPGMAIDLVGLLACHRAQKRDRADAVAIAAGFAVVSSAWCSLAVGTSRSHPRGRDRYLITSYATAPVFGLLGAYRAQFGIRATAAAAAVAGGAWAVATVRGSEEPVRDVLMGSVYLWQAYTAVSEMVSSADDELHVLEDELQADFAEQVRRERRAAVARELDRYERQVDLAEDELRAVGDRMDPEIAAFIAAQCEEVRRWIDDPQTVEALVS